MRGCVVNGCQNLISSTQWSQPVWSSLRLTNRGPDIQVVTNQAAPCPSHSDHWVMRYHLPLHSYKTAWIVVMLFSKWLGQQCTIGTLADTSSMLSRSLFLAFLMASEAFLKGIWEF